MSQFTFDTIGLIRSPYKEKFAIPRQPGLIEDGGGELELIAPYNQPEAVRGLEEFSHLWIVFVFHQTMEGGWRPTVRPPRLGGNARMGVFATRSTFRPNPIGMSLVELKSVETKGGKVILKLGSLDLVDGTPIIDIKPYLPFAESQPQARGGFAQDAPLADMPVISRKLPNGKSGNTSSAILICSDLSSRCWHRILVRPTARERAKIAFMPCICSILTCVGR